MNFYNKPNLRQEYILLIDLRFNGVICSVDNATIASAVSMAYTNTTYFSYPTYSERVSELHKNGSFNDTTIHYMIPDTWTVVPMTEDKITEDWVSYRKLVIQRKDAHDMLDSICRSALVKGNDNDFLNEVSQYLLHDIHAADSTNNYYPDSIKYYAEITECNDKTAYHELKMMLDNSNQRKFRVFSLYMKYRTIINLAQPDMFDKIIKDLKRELYENSWV